LFKEAPGGAVVFFGVHELAAAQVFLGDV